MYFLMRIVSVGTLSSAAVLALVPAQARELAPVDALGNAPLAIQRKAVALSANVQSLSREERLGLPTFVQLRPPAPLAKSRAVAGNPVDVARAELKALTHLYGLTPQEVDAAPLHHVQRLRDGAQLVRLTNQRDGIEIFREQATVLLNAQSQATAIGGYLGSTEPAPQAKAMRAIGLNMPGAIALALQDWGFDADVAQQLQAAVPPTRGDSGPYHWWALPAAVVGADGATLPEPVRAKPVWFRLPQGLVAAYYLELLVHEGGQEHTWAYVVAQDDGRLLLRHNQTAHADAFSYRVFADPVTLTPWPGAQGRNGTPHPTGLPSGYAAPLEAPSLLNLANLPFSRNDPWLPQGATQTLGNNVHAFANLVASDGLNSGDEAQCGDDLGRDFRACTTAPDQFDHTYDHAQGPLASKAQVSASVVNLFYVNNWLHDWFYNAGFDEAAGNAQDDNFGRGGLGGDALRVQALDYEGINNANMWTRADGAQSRMRMYRFANTMPAQAMVSSPASIVGSYMVGKASFGPQVYDVVGEVVAAQDASARPEEACLPITADLTGKIALVDRGTCAFTVKVMNAQHKGAVGVVVVDNAPGTPTILGGTDPQVNIPAIRLSQADGVAWKAQLAAAETVTLRMQSDLAIDRSSALDNSIIAHEWGHFISNRLIGDASGLTSNHARGLGEGWGDFHALLMAATGADRSVPGNDQYQGAYTVGSYAMAPVAAPVTDPGNVALFGMRRYPYSTDLAKNPLTLQHIANNVALPGTVPRNPVVGGDNSAVHNMGEVWASMLWGCYASLLNAHPFAEAQERMKRSLVAGYKLTPVNPTLTEARDALLAAVAAGDPADRPRCAAAFAQRGAGPLALVPDRFSTTNTGVVEDFGSGGVLAWDSLSLSMAAPEAQRCDADTVLDSGETGVLTLTLHNRGFSAVTGAQLALSANLPNLQFPDGDLSVPPVAAGGTVTLAARVRLTGLVASGAARITASLTQPGLPVAQRTLDVPLHRDQIPTRLTTDDAEAEPSAMEFGSTHAAHASAWGVKIEATQPHNRFYAGSTPEAKGWHWMRTPVLQVAATGDFTVSFKHRYRFEQNGVTPYDGGQLMISTDGGNSWASVDRMAAGYTGMVDAASDNPIAGQWAYVGQSANWPAMAVATVNLGTVYANRPVRLAWVIHTDPAVGTEGWEVDDIAITGITNTPFSQVVADAQACNSLAATAGTPQSAPVGTAFAQPLRVRLLDVGGQPMAGQAIAFSAPGAGASATLSSASALTDASGYASVTVIANGAIGSYLVTATNAGHSARFALRNTAAPVGTGGPGGGGGSLSISGPSPYGQGTVSATVQSATTPLPAQAYFSQELFASESGAGAPAIAGYDFPYGLVGFALENVGAGNAVTLRIQYPDPVPSGAEYWKYGRTTPAGAPHWHQIPMTLVGGAGSDTIEITLTDGGLGDTDVLRDGTITDPGGLRVRAAPGPGGAAPIPVLSPFALVLLAAGIGLTVWRRSRR